MTKMTPELQYLFWTAILTSVLWIPVVVGYVRTRGPIQAKDYKVAPTGPLPDWVNRASRAHTNALENLVPFAAVVLIASVLGLSTPITILAATAYFWIRLVHALVHITGFSLFKARTVLFTLGWLAFLTFAVEVFRHAT